MKRQQIPQKFIEQTLRCVYRKPPGSVLEKKLTGGLGLFFWV